ncbi:hypothetical protein VD0004_g9702 [Verticillium dahliae]|nr:hypothetical protein VD0004_g9702 [Verticillium dahliae]
MALKTSSSGFLSVVPSLFRPAAAAAAATAVVPSA